MDYFPKDYRPLCVAALGRFCDDFVPCEFTSKKCGQCLNVKSAHVKGHQNEKGKITVGAYRSSFEAKTYSDQWISSLLGNLETLAEEFTKERRQKLVLRDQDRSEFSDLEIAVRLHSQVLSEFYSQSKSGDQCFSNASCFGCLMAVPQHPLGCGHILCASCIKEHGQVHDDLVVLTSCPLHREGDSEWQVHQKPEFAGLRILCLDG